MNTFGKQNLALALDNCSDLAHIEFLVEQTRAYIGVYKIGLEQFTRFGPSILQSVRADETRIFLDLKLHDIPNTVAKAVGAACGLGIDYLTIHTCGGSEMMIAAVDSAKSSPSPAKIIGVTVLTSIDQKILNSDLNVSGTVPDQVRHLTRLAVESDLDGIVCSAADLSVVKPLFPENFTVITPGIRPAGADTQDQKRVATPREALAAGSSLLVIGRPITGAENPGKAAREIAESIL